MRRAASIAVIVTTAALVTSGDSFASDSPSTGRTDVAGPGLAVVSEDPYTNDDTYHRTQVEPDTSSIGSTIVTAFQTGRSFEWGASNLGWSVSSDGARWTDGFLPHTTIYATPPGHWERVVDPSIAYDVKHDTWLVEGLGTKDLSGHRDRLFVSLSTDGARTFGDPIIVARADGSQIFDKNWITCDNTPTSPYYGNCYTAWDDDGHNIHLHERLPPMAASRGPRPSSRRAPVPSECSPSSSRTERSSCPPRQAVVAHRRSGRSFQQTVA